MLTYLTIASPMSRRMCIDLFLSLYLQNCDHNQPTIGRIAPLKARICGVCDCDIGNVSLPCLNPTRSALQALNLWSVFEALRFLSEASSCTRVEGVAIRRGQST